MSVGVISVSASGCEETMGCGGYVDVCSGTAGGSAVGAMGGVAETGGLVVKDTRLRAGEAGGLGSSKGI